MLEFASKTAAVQYNLPFRAYLFNVRLRLVIAVVRHWLLDWKVAALGQRTRLSLVQQTVQRRLASCISLLVVASCCYCYKAVLRAPAERKCNRFSLLTLDVLSYVCRSSADGFASFQISPMSTMFYILQREYLNEHALLSLPVCTIVV